MVYGLWHSAAGLQAQEYRQAIIANNLANAETPGFKADRVAFHERLSAAMSGGSMSSRHAILDQMTGGLFERPTYTDFSQGSVIPSNSPLDVAIDGEGFLVVQTVDGPRYTRDGRMVMNKDGMLAHAASGNLMLDSSGLPITLDIASTEPIKIDESGMVRQGAEPAGRLGLVDFADHRQLEKQGKDLYSAATSTPLGATGRVKQHAYEASGVEPISALVEMIAVARTYETNAKMITLQDETLGRAVNDLGKIG